MNGFIEIFEERIVVSLEENLVKPVRGMYSQENVNLQVWFVFIQRTGRLQLIRLC